MSKQAVIIQKYNDKKREFKYFIKGLDVTESVKILLARHKEEYDKQKKYVCRNCWFFGSTNPI